MRLLSLIQLSAMIFQSCSPEGRDGYSKCSYVNQFDVTASLLSDFFTPDPDYTPYTLEKHDGRIFDAELSMKKYRQTIDWRKIEQGHPLDNEIVERERHYNPD
jgi:hypothetical protein